MSVDTLSTGDRELLGRVKAVVLEQEPTAEVILYGSRARGDATPESDWDLIVLVDGPVNHRRERRLIDKVYDLSVEIDEVITAFMYSRDTWSTPLHRAMPFHQNVTREGVRL